MSNIKQNSLVFALPNDPNEEGKMIMCQMPIDMIMNWMFTVSPHREQYRRVQNHYISLSEENGINPEDSEAIIDFSNDSGMRGDIQILMMNVIIDLHKVMGTEDFLELYKLEADNEDNDFLSAQTWVGDNGDGTTLKAKLVNDIPEYDPDPNST